MFTSKRNAIPRLSGAVHRLEIPMKALKTVLLLLLVVTFSLYITTAVYQSLSGVHDAPTIRCSQEILEVSVRDQESALLSGVTAADEQDGDLTDQIIVGSISKLISDDTAKVTYLVFDSDDNGASCSRYIRYTDYHRPTLSISEELAFASKESAAMLARIQAFDVIDGDISDSVRISTLASTDTSGVYSVTAQVTNSMGDTSLIKLPVIIREGNAARPVIRLTDYLVYLDQGSSFNPMDYLSSIRVEGQSLPLTAVTVEHQVDTANPGTYWVCYSYSSGGLSGLAILTVEIV